MMAPGSDNILEQGLSEHGLDRAREGSDIWFYTVTFQVCFCLNDNEVVSL